MLLSSGDRFEESPNEVFKGLMRAADAWVRKIEATKNDEVRRNSITVLRAILRELLNGFDSADTRKVEAAIKTRVPELSRAWISRDGEEHESSAALSSMDSPIEYRAAKEKQQREAVEAVAQFQQLLPEFGRIREIFPQVEYFLLSVEAALVPCHTLSLMPDLHVGRVALACTSRPTGSGTE